MHCRTGAGCRLLLYDGRNLTIDKRPLRPPEGRLSSLMESAAWTARRWPALSNKVLFRAQSRKLTGRHEGPDLGRSGHECWVSRAPGADVTTRRSVGHPPWFLECQKAWRLLWLSILRQP